MTFNHECPNFDSQVCVSIKNCSGDKLATKINAIWEIKTREARAVGEPTGK